MHWIRNLPDGHIPREDAIPPIYKERIGEIKEIPKEEPKEPRKTILKVLVGSHAHGLSDNTSDVDYRAVYIVQTKRILSLGFKYKGSSWVEGETEDNTAWELGHFLKLATKCNPTALEVFKAPIVETTPYGDKLRALWPYIWNTNDVVNAFRGYAANQKKKFFDKEERRQNKFAVAYIRTLLHLLQILEREDFEMAITHYKQRKWLRRIKEGNFRPGDVIEWAERLERNVDVWKPRSNHVADIPRINEFLLKVRKENWDFEDNKS